MPPTDNENGSKPAGAETAGRVTPRNKGRRRREEQKEELRSLILHTASELFLERGYHDFSMRKLAERIGYSPATLYLYFKDKDALLFTVVDDAFSRFQRRLAEAADSTADPWERLGSLSEAYVLFGLSHPVYYQLMFMWRIDYLTGTPQGEKAPRVEAFLVLVDAVRYAMEQGVMIPGDPEATSDVFWAMMHGIVAFAIQMPMYFDEGRTLKLAVEAKAALYKAFHL
ncbi:TetR/AcrR family transcriptional regulator [Paenibacillus filicis]|uniref:TetR/AcrR family transcriptional regulator n=1 Tax=Paenibacillus gyeongsangnamensis TaxID=3388067 RepID=A0ABT4QC47_9BACL|nr:TetR/AcrR family transcriptional regulator [Paenibacillus filicis]MCZ8514457.1 TetR/AcrR family transcriptional regulator [Paenibacillus filicis]